jgi:hypothetical protein
VEHLHPEPVFRVTDVFLHPFEQGLDLTQVALRFDASLQENIDGGLSHMKVFRASSNQCLHMLNRLLCSTPPLRDMTDKDLRRGKRR